LYEIDTSEIYGEYPAISKERAIEELLAGHYFSGAPTEHL
jgi:hypothetical protein